MKTFMGFVVRADSLENCRMRCAYIVAGPARATPPIPQLDTQDTPLLPRQGAV